MEILCAECLSVLTVADAATAVCPACRNRYSVLFVRGAAPAPREPAAGPAMPGPQPAPAQGPRPPAAAAPMSVAPVGPAGAAKIVVQCPSCGARFRAEPDSLGRSAQCLCGHLFTIQEGHVVHFKPVEGRLLTCIQHANVAAAHMCVDCGAPLCETCAIPKGDGTVQCPRCAVGVGAAPAVAAGGGVPSLAPTAAPEGTACRRHPGVQAVHLCTNCRAPICETCGFVFPGGIRLCPDCATRPSVRLSKKRKVLVGWALGLAVWGTLGITLLLVIGATGGISGAEVEALGVAVGFLVVIPTLIGTGLGIAAFDRRLGNSPIVWVASIWNIVLLGILVLLNIVGLCS